MNERIEKMKQSIQKDRDRLQKLQQHLKEKEDKLHELERSELLCSLHSIVVEGFDATEIIQAIKSKDTERLYALINHQKEEEK